MTLFTVQIHILVLYSGTKEHSLEYVHVLFVARRESAFLHTRSVVTLLVLTMYLKSLLHKSHFANLRHGLAEFYVLLPLSFTGFSEFKIFVEVLQVPNIASNFHFYCDFYLLSDAEEHQKQTERKKTKTAAFQRKYSCKWLWARSSSRNQEACSETVFRFWGERRAIKFNVSKPR